MRLIDADKIDFHYLPLRAVLKDLYITKSEVDKMPTVEAEPIRRGKWNNVLEFTHHQPKTSFCSICRGEAIKKYKYCPFCGAKMDEEETDAETRD